MIAFFILSAAYRAFRVRSVEATVMMASASMPFTAAIAYIIAASISTPRWPSRFHFANVVGRQVALRTAADIEGRKRFRGELVAAGEGAVTVRTNGQSFDIPYEAIVRGNLIDESERER